MFIYIYSHIFGIRCVTNQTVYLPKNVERSSLYF